MTGTRRLRTFAAVTLMTLLSVCVACALVELLGRRLLPEPWWLGRDSQKHKPLAVKPVGDLLEVVRQPLSGPPPCGHSRIAFLGDSFTYGFGIRDARKTFVGRLKARLGNKRHPRLAVFNGGIPGSHTDDWVRLYDRVEPLLQPDLVLIVFFLRDGQRAASNVGQLRKIRQELQELSERDPLFRHSAVYRTVRAVLEQRRIGQKYLDVIAAGYLGSPEERQEWKRAQLDVLAIREQASRRGARVAMVVFPILYELHHAYPMRGVVQEIMTFAADHGIPAFSLLEAFMGQDGPSLWIASDDAHPNERGHALAADAMEPFVREQLRAAGRTPCNPSDYLLVAPPERVPWVPLKPTSRSMARLLADLKGNPQTRRAAIKRAVATMDASMTPELARFIPNRSVAPAVLDIFEDLGTRAVPAVPVLLQALREHHMPRNYRLLQILGPLGEAVVPALGDMLEQPQWHMDAMEVIPALGARAGALAPRMVRILVSTSVEREARMAARVLGMMGMDAADELEPMVQHKDAVVRARVFTALGYFGPHLPDRFIPRLAKALGDEAPLVRTAAAVALWQSVPRSLAASTPLERVVKDGPLETRIWAQKALRELGTRP